MGSGLPQLGLPRRFAMGEVPRYSGGIGAQSHKFRNTLFYRIQEGLGISQEQHCDSAKAMIFA